MEERTETLTVGARAPEFSLSAANGEEIVSLSGFLSRASIAAIARLIGARLSGHGGSEDFIGFGLNHVCTARAGLRLSTKFCGKIQEAE
jgi:hypothetical protein